MINGLARATLTSLGEQHNPKNNWSILDEYPVHSLFHIQKPKKPNILEQHALMS